jgi:hypothetical protein
MSKDGVEVVEKKTVYSGYFRIDRYRLRYSLYEGGTSAEIAREVFERGQVAALLMVDPDRDAVVLIEQFRPGPFAAGDPPWLMICFPSCVFSPAPEPARKASRCSVGAWIHRTPGAFTDSTTKARTSASWWYRWMTPCLCWMKAESSTRKPSSRCNG